MQGFSRDAGHSFSRARFASWRERRCPHSKTRKQLFCIRPAMEAFADEQPSLVMLVQGGHVVAIRVGSCSASNAHSR
jgi:ribosomal protein L32E